MARDLSQVAVAVANTVPYIVACLTSHNLQLDIINYDLGLLLSKIRDTVVDVSALFGVDKERD